MKLIWVLCLATFLGFPSVGFSQNQYSEQDSDIETDTETVTRKKKSFNDDGSEETEVRSGKVRPRRQGGPRVGEIYNEDTTRVVKRVETLRLFSFSTGPVGAGNLGNSNMFYGLNIASHYEVSPWAEIRLSAGAAFASQDRGSFTSVGIGGSWFATNENISPLLGGEFGYASVTGVTRDLTGGFQVGVHGGLRFFRVANAQMSLEAFSKMALLNGDKPTIYGLQIGVLF